MMYLQEEYIQRHGLTDVAVINHVTNGSILLKMDQGYILMTISWKESQSSPGHYYINYYTPIHDGYARSRYFHKIPDVERELDWDEYNSFIYNWSKGQIDPVIGDKEVILAAWEVFVYCCDGWFVDYGTQTLEKLIFRSLDAESSIDQRFQGYQEALVLMSTEFPAMLKAFKYEVVPHVQHYCHWLAKLIKSHEPAN
jgi:hypothetical protein